MSLPDTSVLSIFSHFISFQGVTLLPLPLLPLLLLPLLPLLLPLLADSTSLSVQVL
jgi:hypothetical protein